jgi:hypothetical protein
MEQTEGDIMQIKIIKVFGCSCGTHTYPHEGIRNPKLHQKGKLNSYDYEVTKWCCKEMQDAFDERKIMFGKEYDSINKNVNLAMGTVFEGEWYREEIQIRFCPFCAEKIIIKG